MDDNILSLLNQVTNHEKRIEILERTISQLKDVVLNLRNRDPSLPIVAKPEAK